MSWGQTAPGDRRAIAEGLRSADLRAAPPAFPGVASPADRFRLDRGATAPGSPSERGRVSDS